MTEDTNCDVSLFVYPSLRDNSDINSLVFKAESVNLVAILVKKQTLSKLYMGKSL